MSNSSRNDRSDRNDDNNKEKLEFDRSSIAGMEQALATLFAHDKKGRCWPQRPQPFASLSERFETFQKVELPAAGLPPGGFPQSNPPVIIHVAGTKGKGSTCAMTASILHAAGLSTGMYCSPHLVTVQERFRLNGQVARVPQILQAFWAVWDSVTEAVMNSSAEREGDEEKEGTTRVFMPSYARLLTMVSWKLFTDQGCQVVVVETGVGGRFDATNVVQSNVAGITHIGIDHVEELGETIEKIAHHKAGICEKESLRCIVVAGDVREEARQIVASCAHPGARLVMMDDKLEAGLEVGLAGEFQRWNAATAVVLAREAFQQAVGVGGDGQELSAEAIAQGLSQVNWPGRCQRVKDSVAINVEWWIDGAHTVDSMKEACQWFQSGVAALAGDPCMFAVLFNCAHTRDPVDLLTPIVDLEIDWSLFLTAPPNVDRPHAFDAPCAVDLLKKHGIVVESECEGEEKSWQHTIGRVWTVLNERAVAPPQIVASVSNAVDIIRRLDNNGDDPSNSKALHVLVVGSLYTAGNCLEAIGWTPTCTQSR